MSAPPSDVAQLLRHFRIRAGLTQEALAATAGLSSQAISALENGRRRHPRAVTIDLLTAALGLSSSDREQLENAASRRSDVPAHTQLPPPISDFTGRSRQLAELEELLRTPYGVAPAVVISAVGGMGGIGKTTLAVQAANLVTAEYPDGQLYLNLRGGTGNPLGASEAIDALLKLLGIPPAGTSDPQAAANRYRTALAGRRMLILLDDAAGAAQVLPLIPGTAGSAVLITSRQRLSGVPGVRRIDLDVLGEREAVQLLAEIVGPAVITQKPEDALRVVRRCGLLPLAIRIAGGQCAKSARGLEELAAHLADDAGRLNALTGPGRLVNNSIALSLSALSAGQGVDIAAAEAFRTPRICWSVSSISICWRPRLPTVIDCTTWSGISVATSPGRRSASPS